MKSKIFKSIGTFLVVAAPIAIVVSCNKDDSKNKTITLTTGLYLGVPTDYKKVTLNKSQITFMELKEKRSSTLNEKSKYIRINFSSGRATSLDVTIYNEDLYSKNGEYDLYVKTDKQLEEMWSKLQKWFN